MAEYKKELGGSTGGVIQSRELGRSWENQILPDVPYDETQLFRLLGELGGFNVLENFVDKTSPASFILVSVKDVEKLRGLVRLLLTPVEQKMSGVVNNYDEKSRALLSVLANIALSGRVELKPLTPSNLDDDASDLHDFLRDIKGRAVAP